MRSLYNFVIEPIGQRYNNVKSINDKQLIVNSENFNHEFVNRKAKVLSLPKIGEYDIQIGDTVIVHHNVFRRWLDIKGRERNSKSFFKENIYIVSADQIFLRKTNTNWSRFKEPMWQAMKGYCFVQPLKAIDDFNTEYERPLIGIVEYTDGKFSKGDLVGFRPSSEYEFIIEGKRLYRVMNNFITIKYEYQGNEEAYNPSWAQSS